MRYLILLSLCAMFALEGAEDKKLKIEEIALAQSEDGTPFFSGYKMLPGDTVFFSCKVSGFARQGDEPPKIFLSYQIEARDAKGTLILPVEAGKVAADLSPEDKEWRPKIRHTIALPALADSGPYTVTVKVKDEYGKAEAEGSVSMTVQGRAVAVSETLVVRNFRFLRTEDDKDPLQVAAYRPGDTVWARFDMTGYKLGDKNQFDVEYGLRVLKPNGETTYEQARAADEKNQSFYPQRYTPGILSLNLPKDLKKGQYTVVLTVRDNFGGQTYETREKFDVE